MIKGGNKKDYEIVAKTTYGLEDILAQELAGIGADDIKILNRAVSYRGDTALLYRSNYCLRTALRILKPVASLQVSDEHELYEAVRIVSWSDFLDKKGTLAVDATVKSKHFTHSHYVAQKVKDAVVDQFRDRYGMRPSVDLNNPHLRINIHIAEKKLTISLDSSGDSLHKRGYRISQGIANLSEVLAAGMIMLTGWKGDSPFVDLMCGSGTLPIEAALIAHKIPPGYYRKEFGFQHWPDFRYDILKKIRSEYPPSFNPAFLSYGLDNTPEAIRFSRKNAEAAQLKDYIKFEVCDIVAAKKPADHGIIVMNPPYGERLKQDDLNLLYKTIGNTLKNNFQGFNAWILSSNPDAFKHIGLHPDKRITLFNGQLECKFNHYGLYPGSRKHRITKI
ncbi:MAG: methyltransferase [Bacteroidales bacterium]|nr:methyltransferase [Bacteroidales bacterium]